jgi:hypothetical protein
MGITQVMIVLQSQFNIIKEKKPQTQLNVSPGYDRLDQSLNDRFSFGTRMLRAVESLVKKCRSYGLKKHN